MAGAGDDEGLHSCSIVIAADGLYKRDVFSESLMFGKLEPALTEPECRVSGSIRRCDNIRRTDQDNFSDQEDTQPILERKF